MGVSADCTYALVKLGEFAYPDASISTSVKADRPDSEPRRINGEALNPPCIPNLNHGETAKNKLAVDPIDAAIGVANDGLKAIATVLPDVLGSGRPQSTPTVLLLSSADRTKLEAAINAGREDTPEDRRRVLMCERRIDGQLNVHYRESPNEARLRHQSREAMDNSYHSSIVANPHHSRMVTVMDVAIGQARALDDPEWRELFTLLADWRTKKEVLVRDKRLPKLPESAQNLALDVATYYESGEFPTSQVPKTLPAPVVSETVGEREKLGRSKVRNAQTVGSV